MNIEVKEKRGIKRWYYDFTLERKRHRDFLDPVESMSRRQAVAAVERIRAAIISKGSEYKREKRIDIKEIFDSYKTYLEEHRKSTFKNFRYVFHSFRVFHDGDITMDDIVEYQKKRSSEEASGATINREIGIAKAAFNRAIKNGIWKRQNPFQLADKYEAVERERYLSEEELVNLLAACRLAANQYNPHIYEIVILGIMTGLRKEKILTMHARNFGDDLQTYTVKKTGTNKYKKSNVVIIPQMASSIIKDAVKRSKSGYLFENPRTGKPYGNIKRTWATALKFAKIEDFRFHDLRHTFGTYALLATRDLKGVQEAMNHSTIGQTSKYAHILNERKAEVMALTNSLISRMVVRNVAKIDSVVSKNSSGKGLRTNRGIPS